MADHNQATAIWWEQLKLSYRVGCSIKVVAKSHGSLKGHKHTVLDTFEQDFVIATWNAANGLFDSMKGKKIDHMQRMLCKGVCLMASITPTSTCASL